MAERRPSEPTSPPLPTFGRTPRGIFVLAGLLGAAAILATLGSVLPWYVDNGTVVQPGGYLTYTQYFTPGPGGYMHSCATYPTGNLTTCVEFSFNYSAGAGTQLMSALYDGILGVTVTTAVLAFAGAVTISAERVGRVRARTARLLVVTCTAVAIATAVASAILLPAFQGPAFTGFSGCPGYGAIASPCNSFVGHASCLDYYDGQCSASNLSWYPVEGWYLAIGSAVVLAVTLVALHFQPLGAPCPFCGTMNRFPARYCDTCGQALPAVKEKDSVGYRL